MPRLAWRALALGIGLVALGAAATVTFNGPVRQETRYVAAEPALAPPKIKDPKAAELARCRTETDADIAECQALWEARRRRFFGQPSASDTSTTLRPLPAEPAENSVPQLSSEGN